MSLAEVALPIEKIHLEHRALLERAYAQSPEETHSELVYRGLWLIAAQLKIDHAVGRLSESR